MIPRLWHPVELIPGGPARYVTLAVAAAAFLAVMRATNPPALKEKVPRGIFALEVAGTAEEAGRILNDWGPDLSPVRSAVWWDFVLILAYGTGLALLCVMAAGAAGPEWLRRLGPVLAWAVFAAAALDVVENVGLLSMIRAGPGGPMGVWPRLAQVCAVIKFALIGAALAYLAAAGLSRVAVALRRTN